MGLDELGTQRSGRQRERVFGRAGNLTERGEAFRGIERQAFAQRLPAQPVRSRLKRDPRLQGLMVRVSRGRALWRGLGAEA